MYHVAVIDYLCFYDIEKYMENFAKTVFLRRDGKAISAVHPHDYSIRFQKFMNKNVIINE